jgi:hypothetical protein
MKKTFLTIALSSAALGIFVINPNHAVRAGSSSNPTANVTVHEGALFANVRSELIKSGWTPMRMHKSDRYEYSGSETDLVKRNILEVDSCSTDQGSLCTFYYAKSGTCLRVDTVGEEVNSMRVTGWRESCPNDAPERDARPTPGS